MSHRPLRRLLWPLALALGLIAAQSARAQPVAPSFVRLYAIDCGKIVVRDMAPFADTVEYDGKPGTLAAPCFLIQHPKGTLL